VVTGDICFLVPAALIFPKEDIRSLAKLRKLKQYAVNADVSGLVKVATASSRVLERLNKCTER
jgi:hypothetical protein